MHNGSQPITLTRCELYDLVWSTPMRQLAARFGLSDVGLAKICSRYDIPRPPRGYWAQKEVGKEPAQTALPNPGDSGVIQLCELINPPVPAPSKNQEVLREPRIEVADSLRGAHKLVTLANQELQGAPKDDHGLLVPPKDSTLELRVSKANLRRALLILDALLKALEQRGYPVSTGPAVEVDGIGVRFGISECLETRREQPEEPDLDGDYRFGFNRFTTSHVPSGRLELHLHGPTGHWASGCQQVWRDTKKSALETRLNRIVAGVVDLATRIKQDQEETRKREEARQAAERVRQEEARQRAEKRERFKAERARVDALLQQAKGWRQSQDLRCFIEAARQKHLVECGPIEPGSEFARWLIWSGQQADRLDPLRESPPSILDEKIEDEEHHERG